MNPIDLSPKQLRQAANIQEKIQLLQKELNQLLGASAPTTEAPRKKWKMGAAGRARIAAAARARWAKIRAAKAKATPAQKPKIKRSAAWKAAISAAAKARWAIAKAQGKARL
jgi:hypothetical protein